MDAVEEVKSRINIEDVIGEYVQLKRSGRNLKGLSPFTQEKTPSFMVSPEKQIWHDFSSGQGGNVFSFVMEMEGLDFKGALELLARKAGVDLSQYQSGRSGDIAKKKERILQSLELAAHFYQVQFSKNKLALEYVLGKRQFSKVTALQFRLGYAPNNGAALAEHLKKKGFTGQELQDAGLITRRRQVGDMFRGRLMIPLQDPQGQVVGFTARLLEDDPNAPKYINTPQTLVYDKGRHVYGLHLAKEAVRQRGYVVVTEGNLDVIASHQAGIKQVVATAGTAVTEMHLKAMQRFTPDVRLAFDQDKAGQAATERAIPIAGRVGVNLGIITITAGKDPDELIRQDKKLWQATIDKPQVAFDWLIDRYASQLDLNTAPGKRQFSDILLPVVRQLPDAVEQDHYLRRLSDLLGVNIEALRSKLRGKQADVKRLKSAKTTPQIDRVRVELTKTQDQFLCLILMQPALRHYLKTVTDDMLTRDEARMLLRFLWDNPDFNGDPKTAEPLREVADYAKILSLQFEELYQGLELLELRNEAARLQARLIETYVRREKQTLIESLRSADETATAALLEQVKRLDLLLKKHTSHTQ